MLNFSDWKSSIYSSIYNDFQQKIDDRLEVRMRKASESLRRRDRAFPFDVLKSPLGVVFRDTFAEYIEIPCLSCGKTTKKTKNHTYPLSNLVSKFLSRDGHLVEFHLGTEREEISAGGQQWAFPRGSFTRRGEKNVSIFHGFCPRCDHRIFIGADSKALTNERPKAIFEQLYRVLCSIYYTVLNHTIIWQYIIKKEEEIGWRVGPHSIFTDGRNPVTGETMNPHQLAETLLYESHRFYNLMKDSDFNKIFTRPQHFKDIIKRRSIKVKKPSVIGSFLLLDRRQQKGIKVNNIIRTVTTVGIFGIVYPVSKTETVCRILGLPLGVSQNHLYNVYNEIFSSYIDIERRKGYKISLSKILAENLILGKNLLLSGDFFDSLSKKQKDILRFASCAKGDDRFPEVDLFF